jgi:hypothetical protein
MFVERIPQHSLNKMCRQTAELMLILQLFQAEDDLLNQLLDAQLNPYAS